VDPATLFRSTPGSTKPTFSRFPADIARFNARLERIADRRLRRAIAADIVRLEKRRAAELKRLTAELHEHRRATVKRGRASLWG
jgi:hypothetical protein